MFVTSLAVILSFVMWTWVTYLGWNHWTSMIVMPITYVLVFWLRRKIFWE